MFCTQCGTKVPDKGGFCPECGAPITADDASEQAASDSVAAPVPQADSPAQHPQADKVAQPGSPAQPAQADSPFAPQPGSPTQPAQSDSPFASQPGFQPGAPASQPQNEVVFRPLSGAAASQPFQPGTPSPQPGSPQPQPGAAQQPSGATPQPGTFASQPSGFAQPQPGFQPSQQPQPQTGGFPQQQPQPGGAFTLQPSPQPGFQSQPQPQPGIPPQPGFQPGVPPQQPFPAPPQALQPQQAAPKKKRKTGLFVGLGAAVLVILGVVGGIVGFNIYQSNLYDEGLSYYANGQYQESIDTLNKLGDDYEEAAWYKTESQRWLDYEAANTLLAAEDYTGAKDAFTALGDFQDSYDQMLYCQNMLDYLQAIEYFESGNYESAREMFVALVGINFKDSSEWIDKTDYAMAEKLAADGKMYEAYKAFKDLGGYSDSADRANQCTTPFPATGILYHNEAFYSSRSAIVLDSGGSTRSAYFKIYSGEALVAAIWLNPGTSQQIELPPGDYSIKMATGDVWFGDEVMFGDEGNYRQLMFEDGSSSTYLGDNIKMTLTMAVSDGNVSGRPTNASDF